MEEKKELLDQDERVVEIELERLRGFVNHPFKVQADSQMIELQESIKKYGILNPLISLMKTEGRMQNLWRMPFIIRKILIHKWKSRMKAAVRLLYRMEWMRSCWWRYWEIQRWLRYLHHWQRQWKYNKSILWHRYVVNLLIKLAQILAM